ncbi:hypothetical protein [Geodermatophilus amargosae]|uniref:hypothetical protein n=1 Tax=Geodermatophilus amargosae TaxID=1296565 RepID=UPI0034DECF3B
MLPRTRLESLRGAPRPLSTGHLLADCERWCRDNLPPRQVRRLRSVPAPTRAGSLRVGARALAGTAQAC